MIRLIYFSFFVFISTLAQAGDCIDSIKLMLPQLDLKSPKVPMTFCKIPAQKNVIIGQLTKRLFSSAYPILTKDFSSFHMGEYEVSQEQYNALMPTELPWYQDGPEIFELTEQPEVKIGPKYPATYVSYKKIQIFLKRLNEIDPTGIYRLPNELEWEYAAGGIDHTEIPWKDIQYIDQHVFSLYTTTLLEAKHPQPVDKCPTEVYSTPMRKEDTTYCRNKYGLKHVLGNVMEWTNNHYFDYAKEVRNKDGHKINAIPTSEEIIVAKGGSWKMHPDMKVTTRYLIESDHKSSELGFRVMRIEAK